VRHTRCNAAVAVSSPNGTNHDPAGQRERGAIDLVEAVIDDSRALIGAHVDALREDLSERLTGLGAALTSTLLAFSIMIVTALLLGIAIAQTLIAVGLAGWAAYWIVTAAGAVLGLGLARRAKTQARSSGDAAGDAAERVKDDVAWIAGNATQESPPQLPAAQQPQ